MRSMFVEVVTQTGYGEIRRLQISVPLVPQLLDGVKYLEPEEPAMDLKSPETEAERRRQRYSSRRGPTFKAMVRYAVQSAAADELAERIPRSRDEGELAAELDRLLMHD